MWMKLLYAIVILLHSSTVWLIIELVKCFIKPVLTKNEVEINAFVFPLN